MTPLTLAEIQEDFEAIMDRAAQGETFILKDDKGDCVLMSHADFIELRRRAGLPLSYPAVIERDEEGDYIRIPDEMLLHLGWKEGDELVFTIEGKGRVIVQKKNEDTDVDFTGIVADLGGVP